MRVFFAPGMAALLKVPASTLAARQGYRQKQGFVGAREAAVINCPRCGFRLASIVMSKNEGKWMGEKKSSPPAVLQSF